MIDNNKIEEIMSEIRGYKQLLTMSDYKAIKYSEGLISEEDYEPIKQYREDLRNKINELEAEIEILMIADNE